MASYNRPVSPGGRRIQNPGRVSDNLAEQSRDRSNSYASPKSSGGVIPISSETFVNYPAAQQQRYEGYMGRPPSDAYANRPRQTSVGEPQRSASTANASTRSRPAVIQNDVQRPASPQKQNRDYSVTANASKEPRNKETHKKVYSVNDGTANLVADVNVSNAGERHHRRRESDGGERGGFIRPPPTEKDRGRRQYHASGPPSKRLEKSIEDDDAYSYTDARGMFNSTEPSWRDRDVPRPRRNSVDRGSRERPISMLDPGAGVDTRRMSRDVRDLGPPPSTRGWDKVNEMARSSSVRQTPRDYGQSPTRARAPLSPSDPRIPQSPTRGSYADSRDPYSVAPRLSTDDRRYLSVNTDRDRYDQYDYRQPRIPERRNSTTRANDRSVERRGFGIREPSQDRYGRGSDESYSQQNQYREADSNYAFVGPQRRETAPDMSRYDEQRLESEKRDREDRERDSRRREEEPRNYNRDYDNERPQRRERDDDHDIDRQRERERERMLQPQPVEGERHHHRHGSYRGREFDRNDISPRGSGEALAQPGISSAAAGGLAGAAAAYGISNYATRNEERDRERDRDADRDRERERDREPDRRPEPPKQYDSERLSPRPPELRTPQDARQQDAHSDDGMSYQPERQRADDHDRGLGFAFEAPEPPKSAPPTRDRHESISSRERPSRDFERTHEDPPNEKPPSTLDPDEDYRRRKEQVQRELGRAVPDDKGSDSDPDRERRRREREQRLREREPRNGEGSVAGTNSVYSDTPSGYQQMPGAFDNESVEGTDSTAGRTLRRRPSILDGPVEEGGAQIIDNSASDRRENRVKIVDPPTEEEERKPKGILKKPKEKFPDYPDDVREGVAPLKDAKGGSGIPPGARWTKIDRRLVNPEALEEAKERFEERLDCVIVLRVLTKEDIQKLADRTKAIRDDRYYNEKEERKAERRRHRHRDRGERDEYDDDSENEFKPKAPKMLEAPASAGAVGGDRADLFPEHRDRRRDRDGDRESQYTSSSHGRRDDYADR